jgi:hypothetical protein
MTEDQQPRRRGCSLALIGSALIAAVLALYVGLQVISVLYGIIMPPLPPLPGSAREISHESSDYGIDRWTYASTSEVCGLLLFYETNGGMCRTAPGQCGRTGTDQVESPAVAQCSGETPFSLFTMRWSAALYGAEGQETELDVSREVYWIGTGPLTTPQVSFGELSPSPNATTAR